MSKSTLKITNRHNRILDILKGKHFVNTFEFYRELGTSRATLHRDLRFLNEQGLIKLVRGGAIFSGEDTDGFPALSSYESRDDFLYEERQRIGKKAAELVNNGESIVLGTGRTTFALAKCLRDEKKHVHVFTASLSIAYLLKDSSCEVNILGGVCVGEEGYSVGPYAIEMTSRISCQKLFLGAGAVDLQNVMHHNSLIVEIEKELVRRAKQIIVLTSYTKFNSVAPYVVTPLTDIHTIITGKNIPSNYAKKLREKGVRLILV